MSFKDLYRISPPGLKQIVIDQWKAKQNPTHHPEGNTLKHIIVVTNRAFRDFPDNKDIQLAAYFHDLGKLATYNINPKTGQPTAYGHEVESSKLIDEFSSFIKQQGANPEIVNYIVINHMKIKPSTWDVMKPSKKDPIINDPSYQDLEKFGTIDKGGLLESIYLYSNNKNMPQLINEAKRLQKLAGLTNESQLNEESSMQFYRKSFPWETFKNKAKELFPDAEIKIEHWEDQSNPGIAWGTTILSKQLTKDQLEQIANTFSELKNEEEVKKPSTAKPTTLDKIKSFFKKKPQQESIEQTVNEALRRFRLLEAEETVTPEQATQKVMSYASKIENSSELDKAAKQIANDPKLMAQLQQALAKGGVQADLNEAAEELDNSDMKTLMLNFAKKGKQMQERISNDLDSDTSSVGLGMATTVVGGIIGGAVKTAILAAVPAAASIFAGPALVGAAIGLGLFLLARKVYLLNNPDK